MRSDIEDGLFYTWKTKGGDGGDIACDGQSKALVGRDFLYNVEVGSGKRRMRPFDRQFKTVKVKWCKKCQSKHLEHQFSPTEERMQARCRACETITKS